MNYYTNKSGCKIAARMHPGNVFAHESTIADNAKRFHEAITTRFIEIEFGKGREIYVAICGARNLQIPKKCKTLQDVAAWINTKDF